MKQSMYKNRDELPMFLTVMEVAGLLGSFRAEPSSPVTGSSSGSMSRRDTTELHGERNNK